MTKTPEKRKTWKIQRRDDIAEKGNKEAPEESDEDNKRPQRMRRKRLTRAKTERTLLGSFSLPKFA
jgi:hypothetical protein